MLGLYGFYLSLLPIIPAFFAIVWSVIGTRLLLGQNCCARDVQVVGLS